MEQKLSGVIAAIIYRKDTFWITLDNGYSFEIEEKLIDNYNLKKGQTVQLFFFKYLPQKLTTDGKTVFQKNKEDIRKELFKLYEDDSCELERENLQAWVTSKYPELIAVFQHRLILAERSFGTEMEAEDWKNEVRSYEAAQIFFNALRQKKINGFSLYMQPQKWLTVYPEAEKLGRDIYDQALQVTQSLLWDSSEGIDVNDSAIVKANITRCRTIRVPLIDGRELNAGVISVYNTEKGFVS